MGVRAWLTACLMMVGGWLLARWMRSNLIRFAVEGESMTPTVAHGDYLVALRLDGRGLPEGGSLVIVRDPRDGRREMVKRAVASTPEGSLVVLGDNPRQSTDSRQFGPVAQDLVVARVVARYWPPARMRLLP